MSKAFIRIAVLWMLAGISLGIYMGITHEHSDKQLHVHGLLLGWVSCALFAMAHFAWPRLQALLAARLHFWLHNIGLLALLSGLFMERRALVLAGPLLGGGSVVLLLATALFGWSIWKVTAK